MNFEQLVLESLDEIKVISGPFSQMWRDRYDNKEWAEYCYEIEMWGCKIIWSVDHHWIVPHKGDYQKWCKETNGKDSSIFLDIEDAIKKYKKEQRAIKSGATPDQAKIITKI